MRSIGASIALLLSLAAAGPARAQEEVVAFRCSGAGGIEAMENSYVDWDGRGACWGHLGHHTYDAGGVYEVGAVSGSIFTVEVQFSPPLEYEPPAAAILFEGSVDGVAWTTLATIAYPLTGGTRQGIGFAVDGDGAAARFLRIRQPRSSAQGLSGYLDSSSFDAALTPASAPPVARDGELVCAEHVMERMFAEHPCWFGGVNRYDAPSFFHTYFLGEPQPLGSVRGSVTFLPWRSDDYTQNGGNRTLTNGFVQLSTDGVAWENVAIIAGRYGVPITFDLSFEIPFEVSFIRLVADRHTGWSTHPALKHARGFVVDSHLEI